MHFCMHSTLLFMLAIPEHFWSMTTPLKFSAIRLVASPIDINATAVIVFITSNLLLFHRANGLPNARDCPDVAPRHGRRERNSVQWNTRGICTFVRFAKSEAIFLSGGFHDLRAGTSAGHFKASGSTDRIRVYRSDVIS
jgi:hypothetical protein